MKEKTLTAKEILELPVGTEVNLFKRTEIPFSREHVEKFMGWTKYMYENNNDVFHEIVFPCIIEGFEDMVVVLKGQEQKLITVRSLILNRARELSRAGLEMQVVDGL
jgi:hypothetical protein